MTPLSRECLIRFLNEYSSRIVGSVADYGGNDEYSWDVRAILMRGNIDDYNVLDYSTGYDLLKPIKGKKYDVGICMDLLEHTTNPFKIGETITNSLKPNALLFVTVPFIWALHEFPKDYFRFSVDGIKEVFSKMKCLKADFLTDMGGKPIPKKKIRTIDKDGHFTTRVVAVFEKARKK